MKLTSILPDSIQYLLRDEVQFLSSLFETASAIPIWFTKNTHSVTVQAYKF
jgi:hypothetical protein